MNIRRRAASSISIAMAVIFYSGCSIMQSNPPAETYMNKSIDEFTTKKNYKLAGLAYIELGDYARARKVLHKALSFDPNDAETNNHLGRVYYISTDYPKAIMFLKTAIAIDKQYAEAYYNLGDVYFKNNKRQMAMDCYRKAIDINPGFRNRKRDFYGTEYEPLK